jgi:hypothetical protein
MVKRVLGTMLAERRLAGHNPNWTEVLGSVAAAINLQCGQCKNDVSAYEAVYRDKFDHHMSCSKSEACQCWTLFDHIKVTNEPEFDQFCRENYIIVDASKMTPRVREDQQTRMTMMMVTSLRMNSPQTRLMR